jgi:large subunit ribosomal protein L14
MIQVQTKLIVADNSGAKEIQCIKVLGGSRRRYARIGDIITAVVKKAEPRKETKMHEIVKAVVVRQRKPYRRADGSYISFSDNAAIILSKEKEPRAQRIFGPIPRELRDKGFAKIHSLAQEVV